MSRSWSVRLKDGLMGINSGIQRCLVEASKTNWSKKKCVAFTSKKIKTPSSPSLKLKSWAWKIWERVSKQWLWWFHSLLIPNYFEMLAWLLKRIQICRLLRVIPWMLITESEDDLLASLVHHVQSPIVFMDVDQEHLALLRDELAPALQ